MQQVSLTLQNALKNGHVLTALPKLLVEWDQNRYTPILKIDNTPSDDLIGSDVENFPISTIADSNRPVRGIIKARCSPGDWTRHNNRVWPRTRDTPFGEEGFTSEDYLDDPTVRRYYTTGPESAYKYWTSPSPSTLVQSSNTSFGFPAGKEVQPYILYKKSLRTNKIVVTFETSWARPADYDIQVTANGSTWTTISSNILPDSNGQVIIYLQSTGAWSKNVQRGTISLINGIRLVVRGMNQPQAHLNLIELSPRLEAEVSEFLTDYSSSLTMSESNFITPLGTASSNTASFSLANFERLFNNDNTASIYNNLIDKNAVCTLDLEYDLTGFGGGFERVREFTMFVDQWETDEYTLSASLKDSSKFLQEIKTPEMLLENITVGEAMWRICDAIGFSRYIYNRKETDATASLRYFWTDSEKTVWDTMQELAEATQTAVFFDEFDQLRIQTRTAALDLQKTPSWALEANTINGKLADVISAEISGDYEANIVNISYKETKVSDDAKGFPEMHVLWEPEGDFVLRSSQLTQYVDADDMQFRLTPGDVKVWPFEGMFNVEGEIVKYAGKQYRYYNKAGALTTSWVMSNEDLINIDKNLSDLNRSYLSTFTGLVKITERGALWSLPRQHTVDITGWAGRRVVRGNTNSAPTNIGIAHNKDQSLMRIATNSTLSSDHLYTVTRGLPQDESYSRYGTRMRFAQNAQGRGTAGIVLNSGSNDSGYYVELIRTSLLTDNGGASRNIHNEVHSFSRNTGGGHASLGGKGSVSLIAPNVWYDIDVEFVNVNGNHTIVVYVDSVLHQRIIIPAGQRVIPSGRFGMFVRGHITAEFEYFYAHAPREQYDTTDEVSNYDRIRGGFVSGQWEREYVYGTRDANRRVGKKNITYKQKYNQFFFDEFGAICHEIREMDIEFEKVPVLHSRAFHNNDKAVIPEYNATPFGAKFLIANSGRENTIVNGEDTLAFGPSNTVSRKFLIYGRLVFQEEGVIYTVKNKTGEQENPFQDTDAIRRRGKVEVDIDSKWIQSKAEAKALGEWIVMHWGGGNDEVTVSIFGNPIFQLGDVVTLDYPALDIYRTTHRYFIIGIKNDFDTGLSTSLTLRRAKF